MKYEVSVRVGDVDVTATADKMEEVFHFLSQVSECLSVTQCGMCKSDHVVPRYYKNPGGDGRAKMGWLCLDCKARADIYQTKDGGLFFRRKFDEGIEHNGAWYKRPDTDAPF